MESAIGKKMVWINRIFFYAILSYLIYRITQIGWGEIIGSLPTSPLFYLLSIAIFLVLPFAETRTYRLITGISIPNGFRIFSRKKVLNEALISFSGEAYLSQQLARLPGFNTQQALVAVKDNNIISAFVSNTWTLGLVGALFLVGKPDVLKTIFNVSPVLIGGFLVLCTVVYFASIIFYRKLTKLRLGLMGQVAMIHSGKIIVTAGLQVAQWMCAIPTAAATTWLMFLAVQTLIRRVPGLPSAELVFLGVGLSIVGFADTEAGQISATLVAATAMSYFVQLIAYAFSSSSNEHIVNARI